MKPRIRSTNTDGNFAAGPWSIDFGGGITAAVERRGGHCPVYVWRLRLPDGSERTGEASQRHALLEMSCTAARWSAPAPLDLSTHEIDAWVRSAQIDTPSAIEAIGTLLRRRTGLRWSVSRGRGKRRREEIVVRSRPQRDRDGLMPWSDAVLLASVAGLDVVVPSSGVVVGSTLRARDVFIRQIAGHPRNAAALHVVR